MQLNTELLQKLKAAAARNFDAYLQKALGASAEHGAFGMEMLDRLHEQLPRNSCGNCGRCCNSVSIFLSNIIASSEKYSHTGSPKE